MIHKLTPPPPLVEIPLKEYILIENLKSIMKCLENLIFETLIAFKKLDKKLQFQMSLTE